MNLDASYMQRALENARKGKPSPNPPVGAVVVLGDQVAGEGFHAKAGGEHAEIAALGACSVSPKGGTLYVTLEPCNHTGRTGPCTEAIIAAGISRVVIGCDDPNPHVAGGGIERLQKAGIVKAWQGSGTSIPQECLYVRLAKSNKHIAGLRSNAENKPNKCMQYAFDGAALLYGQKKPWFVLTEGSALSNSECKATANLMGPQPWGDLVDFEVLLGCENVD